ncbi:hypothetical protein ES288_A10G113000v1 [Gossypium darwinii]|uniref:Uncharacterized protein n=2 Tax=Gossypium TaxID=3633 RepID=A0A5D2NNL8_GOSTO|nr:hypothetical protein ES288_A10G113000v1 [Gossypium darwinii]TYI05777.1 hypothetical protein ES332_A10G112800v1 [Gossypium tomentosum]
MPTWLETQTCLLTVASLFLIFQNYLPTKLSYFNLIDSIPRQVRPSSIFIQHSLHSSIDHVQQISRFSLLFWITV